MSEEADRYVIVQLGREISALTTAHDALLEALDRLHNAAEIYAAVQDKATDQRIGLVQPITVAEGNELNAALDSSRQALAGQPEDGLSREQLVAAFGEEAVDQLDNIVVVAVEPDPQSADGK